MHSRANDGAESVVDTSPKCLALATAKARLKADLSCFASKPSSLQITIQQSVLAKSRAVTASPAPGMAPWPSCRQCRGPGRICSIPAVASGICSKIRQNSVSVQAQNQEVNLPAAVSISDPSRWICPTGKHPKMSVRTSGCQPPQALQLSQSSAQHLQILVRC